MRSYYIAARQINTPELVELQPAYKLLTLIDEVMATGGKVRTVKLSRDRAGHIVRGVRVTFR